VRIYDAGLKRAACGSLKIRDAKIAIWAPSHNFVGLRHVSTTGKKLVKEQYLLHKCPHNMANFGPLAAEMLPGFGAPQQISTGFASWQRYYTAPW